MPEIEHNTYCPLYGIIIVELLTKMIKGGNLQ
jgi:hypothetical protein